MIGTTATVTDQQGPALVFEIRGPVSSHRRNGPMIGRVFTSTRECSVRAVDPDGVLVGFETSFARAVSALERHAGFSS